jgi:hypothetical protein
MVELQGTGLRAGVCTAGGPIKLQGGFGLLGLGVAQPGRRAAAQGGAREGGATPPQRFWHSCWAGEGL